MYVHCIVYYSIKSLSKHNDNSNGNTLELLKLGTLKVQIAEPGQIFSAYGNCGGLIN